MIDNKLKSALLSIQKPARYTGGEPGCIIKDKIKPIQRVDNELTFSVRYDDIDVNTHVNNSNYIIWAFETLDIDFRSNKKLKTLDMMYKKEIKYGSRVISQVEIDGNITNHLLKNADTNEEICLVMAEWTDK